MAVLAVALWNGFPQYRGYFGIGAIRYGSTIMPSPNSLLEFYEGANGMKTGYICASGYNIVGTATQGNRTLLAVVLGESSMVARIVTAAALFDAGFASSPQAARVALGSYRPTSTRAAAADLRSTYCPSGTTEADEFLNLDILLTTAMGPKVRVADIIAVATGGADMAAGLRVDVPLPRPRPSPYPANALGVAVAAPVPAVPPLPRPRPAF
jgi:D-alanyl-D-alanine carboxypeptidase